jgi:membrane protease YdiL (CAAX protease family)
MTAEQVAHTADAVGMTAAEAARRDGPAAAWVRAHPVGAFLVWFFTVGWAIAFIPVVAKRALGVDLPFQAFVIASTWLGLLLPAVVITRLVDGPAGVHELRRRVLKVRASVGWYALALLAVPLTSVVLAVILLGTPSATPSTWISAVVSGLLLQTAIGFITTNLWEETAWMGFVQARLQARRGVMLAAVFVAVLFALQHLPLVVENGTGLVVLPVLAVMAIPFRALVAWPYNRTGSLFLVGLLHAAGDAAGSGFGDALLPHLYENDGVGLLPMVAEVLLGLAVIAATRARLGVQARPARPVEAGTARTAGDPVR